MSRIPVQVLVARDNNDVVALQAMAKKAARTRVLNLAKKKASALREDEIRTALADRQAELDESNLPWVVRQDDLLPEEQL